MSPQGTPKQPGLRERKREQQHTAIQRAAIELMLEHSYDAVTVEMICKASEISRRTFFNYFSSKESVAIGSGPGPIPDADREAFVHGSSGEILADLVRLLLSALRERPQDVDPELWRDRLQLIRSTPILAKTLADLIAAKDADLQDLVERRIRLRYVDQGFPPGQGPTSEEQISRQAGIVVSLWWGIARYTMQTTIHHPETATEELIESLLDTLALIQEAEL